MPRFVILHHDWPHPHLDMLLEDGGVLKAWRLPPDPPSGEWVPAVPNVDHRLVYLDYEGPVSGGRGSVSRWAAGEYTGEVLTWVGGAAELRGGLFRWVARGSQPDARARAGGCRPPEAAPGR